MLSIIQHLYFVTPIDNVDSNTPGFYLFVYMLFTHSIGIMEDQHANYSQFFVKSRFNTDILSTKVPYCDLRKAEVTLSYYPVYYLGFQFFH